MKEKTFEELIEDNFSKDSFIVQQKVIAAMKQVREATIKECSEKVFERDADKVTIKEAKIITMPADRIKIKDQ